MPRPLLDYVTECCYMLYQPVFDHYHRILERHFAGVRLTDEEISQAIGRQVGTLHPIDAADQDYDGPSADRRRTQDPSTSATMHGPVAVLPVRGVLARYADQVGGGSQPRGRSYESIQAELRALDADPDVGAIVLRMASPGGTVLSCDETAAMIRRMDASGTPVYAYADGMMASAAYYLASQTRRIGAGSSAMVGSIGTVTSLVDNSRMAEKFGVRMIVVASGKHKATGHPGTPINPEQIAPIQQMVDDYYQAFQANVASGRGLNDQQMSAVNEGQVWVAQRASDLGLVDDICSFDDFLAQVRMDLGHITAAPAASTPGASAPATNKQESTMDNMELAALIEAHPEADAAHIVKLAAEGKTKAQIIEAIKAVGHAELVAQLTQERDEHQAALAEAQGKLQASSEELADLKAQLAEADGLLAKAQQFTADGLATPDAGSDHDAEPEAGDTSDKALKARWDRMTPAQHCEWGKSFEAYCYGMRNPEEVGLSD